jgi:uncharacterized protein (DUF1697 family)
MNSKATAGKRPGRAPREYVAFLRGVNVGGRSVMGMADLRGIFASLGFRNVRTVLASGNVAFTALGDRDEAELVLRIEGRLKDATGLEIEAFLRPWTAVTDLVAAGPFAAESRAAAKRFYVTFLREAAEATRAYAYESDERDIRIFGLSASEVGSTIVLSAKRGTPDLMRLLEKRFGRDITTRNWDTIEKLAAS